MASAKDDAQLRVLLLEYEMLRDDVRNENIVFLTFASVAAAMMIGLGAVLAGAVQVEKPWIYGLLPFPGAALVLLGTIFAGTTVIRSYYGRMLEREIFIRAGGDADIGSHLVSFPSFLHVMHALDGPAKHTIRSFNVARVVLTLITAAAYTFAVAWALVKTDPLWFAVLVGVLYAGIIGLALRVYYLDSIAGHQLWLQALELLPDNQARELGTRDQEESRDDFVTRLLLPRRNDLVKLVFVPAGYGLAWAISGDFRVSVATMLVIWLVFELDLFRVAIWSTTCVTRSPMTLTLIDSSVRESL